jgi:hypothetical protein
MFVVIDEFTALYRESEWVIKRRDEKLHPDVSKLFTLNTYQGHAPSLSP